MRQEEILSWIRKAKNENWDGLDLSRNHISTLPPEIGDLKNLGVLDVSETGLTELPAEIGRLANLKILKLSGNQLSSLPVEIGQLKNLMIVELSMNHLTDIFPEIGQLTNLRELDLSFNKINLLPAEFWRLSQLTELNLSSNQLNALPAEIGQLTQLRLLAIEGNSLTALPAQIWQLARLTRLYLSGNRIKTLPAEIGQLSQLTELSLADAHLAALPAEMEKLDKLEGLYLQDNPLPIPPEILSKAKEPQIILNYYFSVWQQQRKKPLNEIKLIIVGQGSVGKTSLVQRIIEDRFDAAESKTEGIAIHQWQIRGRSSIKLNIWDFGGQEIMHATHQFFLTKRSLYLLVLDARLTQEENRVEYWLKIIQSFGGDSPVLIVGNKTDQHPLDIDRSGLQKKYPNIVGILETSAATGAGIETLKSEIAKQVDTLPHVRDLLPETWFTVKSKLEELAKSKNFFTHDEYLGLCDANNVEDETSQRTLIGFLHDLGIVLHFQDDARLEALGILHPQWVTNGVYKILNWKPLFQHRGVLTLAMLNDVLNLPEYPRDKRLFIVDMMKKFELCYEIEPEKTFLVPDLLPKDEPDTGDWENSLAFEYHYEVLPSSIITRFIVRMNTFIDNIVWRSGVVLKSGGNSALVKADTEDKKIYIQVHGDKHKRRDFLAKIRGRFDAIHASIIKIEAREMVPVPGHPEAAPINYDLLLQMENNGVETYPVLSGGKMAMANVKEMLNGIESNAMRKKHAGSGNITNIYVGGGISGNMVVGNENKLKTNRPKKPGKTKKQH